MKSKNSDRSNMVLRRILKDILGFVKEKSS